MRYLSEIPYPVGSKERKKALGRRHYEMNKEKCKERWRIYRTSNPEKVKQKSRDHHNSIRGRAKSLLNSAQHRSVQRNLDFDIDLNWVISRLEFGKCALTGIDFIFETRQNGHRNPYSPSLDRKDNSQGYTKENCRVILWALNMGFADWGQETYMEVARRLIEYDL
jgi:hypothetical protein